MHRKIDDLGRIVIPKEIRKRFNIEANDTLFINVDGNKIILEKRSETLEDLIKQRDILNEKIKMMEK